MTKNYRREQLPVPHRAGHPASRRCSRSIPLSLVQELGDVDVFRADAYPAVTYVIGVALLGLIDDFVGSGLFSAVRLERPVRADAARVARARARDPRRRLLDRRGEGGGLARPRAVRSVRTEPDDGGVPGRRRRARARHQPLQSARPPAGALHQGAGPARHGAHAWVAWDPSRAAGRSACSSARSSCCCRSTCASAACWATRARTRSAPSPGCGWWPPCRRPGRRSRLAVMAVVTVYGEFRSISALIERTPGLRQLDSLGRIQHA